VNIAKVADQYIALTEIPLPVKFDLRTMDSLGAMKFRDNLPKEFVFDSAHPKVDGRTGEQFNYIVDYGLSTNYIIYKYHPDAPCRKTVAKVPVGKPAYMHSFGLTKNYVILVEFPLVVNPLNIMFMTKPFIQNYYWDPKRGTRFVIVDRCSGKVVKKITTPQAFFAFHHVNAYEENDNIILDIVTYKDACIIPEIANHGYLSGHFVDEKLPSSELVRYTISLRNNCFNKDVLFRGSLELPRINEKFLAYPYRFIYGSDQRLLTRPEDIRPIYKVDTKTGQIYSWAEPGVLPGEPVFIAKPNGEDEEDGVVVNIALDVNKQKAFLLILDGKTFKELGRAYAPFAIPIGLHGQFF
jgi:carotenoid cleavage dioxygenase-like enzyme